MATLSETAYVARKAIDVGVIVLVLIVILRILFNVAVGLKERFFPTPPPPATVAFGKLPYPNFAGSLATPSGTLTYTLETVDGNLPTLPTTMPVYFMPKAGPTFGSFEKMKAQAGKIGFNLSPTKTGPTSWRFVDGDNPLRALDIDEISGNFRLAYNFVSDLALFNERNFTSVDSVTGSARSFFENLGLLSSDLRAGSPTVTFFRLDSGTLVTTNAIANAEAISVSLNRADIPGVESLKEQAGKKFPVVSPDARQGLVSVLFSGNGDNKKRILDARYFYGPINFENWATYPLISAKDAWDKLQKGTVVFASLPDPVPTSFAIRQIYLAYLDPYPPQSYLQPVLVFSDQKGFVAYVPVISLEWYQ